MTGEEKLQAIYDAEQNIRIGWFWDGGIDVSIGDNINGYREVNSGFATVKAVLKAAKKLSDSFLDDHAYDGATAVRKAIMALEKL